MIKFRDIKVEINHRTILDRVSFQAQRGSVTVLLGKNGSGKTTLLRTAAGIQKYSGTILIDERDLTTLSSRERARQISYLPQHLPPTEMTVRELVMCGNAPFRRAENGGKADIREQVNQILAETNLLAYADVPVSTLSGGEKQRAYFAMLTLQDAGIILLDEPTANLDTEYRKMVYDFIRNAKTKGKAVIVVMHHISEACRIADRISVLQNGQMCFSGSVSEFQKDSTYYPMFRLDFD